MLGFLWAPLERYQGSLAPVLGWTQGFFFLLGMMAVPALVLAAPIAFSAQGLIASRRPDIPRTWLPTGGAAGYLVLAMVMSPVAQLGGAYPFGLTDLLMPGLMLLYMLPPISALSIFGFWLPSIACGVYTASAKRPRWWVAGLIGTITLVAGIAFWMAMGVLVGAETD